MSDARVLKAQGLNSNDIQKQLIPWVTEHADKIYNPFLELPGTLFIRFPDNVAHNPEGFDVNRDTPVEVLHTILLGIIKYTWHMTHTSFSKDTLGTFFLRLESTNIDGLSIPPLRSKYLSQYRQSLIGKQFKQLLQTSIFHLDGLVDDAHFNLWNAAGTLCALLWFPEIQNLEEYLSDVKIASDNLLDIFAEIDPSKIYKKIKLHLIGDHLIEDIRRFGPIIGRSTEVFECFNAIFRFCAIMSNRLSPSRDIAVQLADQEAFKQRISGGMWEERNGEWVQASENVRGFLEKHAILQTHIGWKVSKELEPGTGRLSHNMMSILHSVISQAMLHLRLNLASRNFNGQILLGCTLSILPLMLRIRCGFRL